MAPHFRVIKLRYRPGHSPQIEAHAVLGRRHIQLFHDVYMHYLNAIVKHFFTDLLR